MMKAMSKKTKMSADEVFQAAKDYFDGNLGLRLTDETNGCCIEFSSNLGFVTVKTVGDDHDNEVTVSTREFEYQIEDFLKKI